jgi:uncharacterized membrane protein
MMDSTSEDALGPLELKLGRLLFAGVMSAAVCLAAGLGLTLAGGYPAAANVILTTGLVILMITPLARVVTSLAVYVRMRDWLFVGTTILVFVELLLAWLLKTKR